MPLPNIHGGVYIPGQISDRNQTTYIALYDYDARMPDDLTFRQADRLIILDERYYCMNLIEWGSLLDMLQHKKTEI